MIFQICGEDFKPKYVGHKYCSPQCHELSRQFSKTALERRREQISRGLIQCRNCGDMFMPTKKQNKLCPTCSDTLKRREKTKKQITEKAQQITDHAVGKPNERTFADWTREAADCNMDYGNYRAQIEVFGKTYEELKAQAHLRVKPCHSHVGGSVNRRD